MAFIKYVDSDSIAGEHRIPDDDNILRIHGIDPPMMRKHFDLYRHVMYSKGPLSRIQREKVAVAVSSRNGCLY